MFEADGRKGAGGRAARWDPKAAAPRHAATGSYDGGEQHAVRILPDMMRRLGPGVAASRAGRRRARRGRPRPRPRASRARIRRAAGA